MEKGEIDEARANGGVFEECAGASIVEAFSSEFTELARAPPQSPPIPPPANDGLLTRYGLALAAGYRSLSEASVNHFMGLRTDLEHPVRGALASVGEEYYRNLSTILNDARRLGLVPGSSLDASFDYWHLPYQGKEMIEHYGYHYNGMMNRPFPGVHPMTVYDLNDRCFILVTPPSGTTTKDVTTMEAVSLCEDLGFTIASLRGDRGMGSVEITKGVAERSATTTTAATTVVADPMAYFLAVRANSILRKHIRGRGWVEDAETGERACVRKGLDYHGVKTNLVALSKEDRARQGKRRVFLFITNHASDDPFYLLQQYRMRGDHERGLGCLSAIGMKRLPSTGNDDEIAGHLLTFMRLQFVFMLAKRRLGLDGGLEAKTLSNLLLRRPGISWTEKRGGKSVRRTIVFANRALIKRIGRTTLRFDGREITFIEQWRGHPHTSN